MDDKEFDKLMNSYVAGPAKGKQSDLQKFRASQPMQKRTRQMPKLAWAAVAVVLVVAVSLAIVLPITLTDKAPDEGMRFLDEKDFNRQDIDFSEIQSTYVGTYLLPTVESFEQTGQLFVSIKNANKVFGVEVSSFVYDENFIDVKYAITDYRYKSYRHFEEAPLSEVWNTYNIKFNRKDVSGFCENQIYFTDGKYHYYLMVNTFEEMPINQVLDLLFDKKTGA